jgi:GntR family transcriptional regulator
MMPVNRKRRRVTAWARLDRKPGPILCKRYNNFAGIAPVTETPSRPPLLASEPLYKRAEAEMVARIVERVWRPGMRLPNEFDLAAEFGVSQGTIRKALVSLERRGLLSRSPGRGTSVARTTPEASLFSFFRMRDPSGAMTVPEPHSETIRRRPARAEERERLDGCGDDVYDLQRVRQHRGVPFVVEEMRFAASVCEGIEKDAPLPNSLYPYLQERFGLAIMTAEESITAAAASAREVRLLGVTHGRPLLRVERQARDLGDRVVELRTSFYLTTFARYRVDLSRSDMAHGSDDPA